MVITAADAHDGWSAESVGCVHGRFQPFHNGHLEYVQSALVRVKHLYIGITNTDPTWRRPEEMSTHRHTDAANPFTYWQRLRMISSSLADVGIPERVIAIVPFPIHDLTLLSQYVPWNAIHFVRVFTPWEEEKVRRLRSAGLHVEVLNRGVPKQVTATEVRAHLQQGQGWEELVPTGTARELRSLLGKGQG